jgi:phosphate transport system substrate-binding protein
MSPLRSMIGRFATVSAVVLTVGSAAFAQLSGVVSVDGSSTVYPIGEGIAAKFRKDQPEVRVTIGSSGTGGGFKKFVKGETDVSQASRPIKKEEHDAAVAAGIDYIELPIAYDGLSIVVNKGNTSIPQITVDEVKKLFAEGGAKTWKEANPAWPDVPVKLFSPGTDSGTFDYFVEVMGGKDKFKMTPTAQVSEDDNVLVTGVAGDPGAIGFFGSAYYFENQDKLMSLPVVNKKGVPVKPTPATIADGTYAPFSRPLFIYVNKKSLNKPEVKAFVEFYINNAGETADSVGYVGLPDEVYDRAEANLEGGKTGTQFIKDDGKHKDGALADIYQ